MIINAFTVDLEDWFQGLTSTNPLVDQWPQFESRVVAATNDLLGILDLFKVKATFFVLGYVADQYPGLIEEVAAAGHEIGIHGYTHRFVYKLARGEFEREIDMSLEAIHRITATTPLGHRAPYFSINATTPWAFEVLAARGLLYDSSVFPTKNMLYGFPNAPRFPYLLEDSGLMEFPATTMQLLGRKWPIAGGFYNRLQPYGLIKRGIQQVNTQGQPAVLYIHPWELDTGQRYGRVTPRERLTHYYGRGGLRIKLEKLFTDFSFGPMKALLKQEDNAAQGSFGI
ncbi:MAG: DUF3473 domain-containing protein [Anaerolineales bacterium]|nr:DUF3473 domain-containing protein [Anaerolineales bacterium]